MYIDNLANSCIPQYFSPFHLSRHLRCIFVGKLVHGKAPKSCKFVDVASVLKVTEGCVLSIDRVSIRHPPTMSNANPQSNTAKSTVTPKDAAKSEQEPPTKSVVPLEEDDEFEDFPVEGVSFHKT
jgi:hypothetical protein